MPLYFGFPLSCQEAFRLFGLDFEQTKCDIMQKHKLTENMNMDCYFVDYVNNFFKGKNIEMRAFYTDKGQYIVGYEMEKLSVCERNFVTAKHFMYSLHHFETRFWHEVESIGCKENFNKVVLKHMEDEPETVEGVGPYIIDH